MVKMRMRFYLLMIWLVILALLMRGNSVWASGIEYTTKIKGVEDSALSSSLNDNSLLIRLSDKKPATRAGLLRRLRNDRKQLELVLYNFGYYGAQINTKLQDKDGQSEITLNIDAGPIYKIASFVIELSGPGHKDTQAVKQLNILARQAIGQNAVPEDILSIEQKALNRLMNTGYPYPSPQNRKLKLNHKNNSVAVFIKLDSGPRAVFGKTTFSGQSNVKETFLHRRVAWKEGDIFNIDAIHNTRRKLIGTGVIKSADITYGQPDKGGRLPINIQIHDSKFRTIGSGLNYSTTKGPAGSVFWERRNLFGQAEKLRLKLNGGINQYGFSAHLDKPDLFNNTAMTWLSSISYSKEELEAYDVLALLAKTSLNYKYRNQRAINIGMTLDRSDISDSTITGDNTYTILSLPFGWRMDTSDDLLNPQKGLRLNAGITPSYAIDGASHFLTTEFGVSHYKKLSDWFGPGPFIDGMILANRAQTAMIWGDHLNDVPATYRLFSGGGSTARGYGYQRIGPVDASNTPTGGRFLLGATSELRKKWTNDIEGVVFFEGARLSEDVGISGGQKFQWSAGVGGRYHTAIGPLRLDIAVPLNKRRTDDAFQFYISIGQAF